MKLTSLVGAGVLLALSLNVQAAVNLPHQGMASATVQAAAPSASVEFSVYLPLRNQKELDTLIADLHDKKSSNYQHWLQPADFLQRFGPSAADLAALRTALTAQGFTILQSNAHGMRVQRSRPRRCPGLQREHAHPHSEWPHAFHGQGRAAASR